MVCTVLFRKLNKIKNCVKNCAYRFNLNWTSILSFEVFKYEINGILNSSNEKTQNFYPIDKYFLKYFFSSH